MIFHTIKNMNEIGFDSPNLFVSPSKIMDSQLVDGDKDIYEDIIVECNSLDNIVYDEEPTCIKINALAADCEILLGAKNILREYAPKIIMDYGARPNFIKNTIDILRDARPDYKLYLREKKIFGDYKTILYARI